MNKSLIQPECHKCRAFTNNTSHAQYRCAVRGTCPAVTPDHFAYATKSRLQAATAFNQTTELKETQRLLAQSDTELLRVQKELEETKDELAFTKAQLRDVKEELQDTKDNWADRDRRGF